MPFEIKTDKKALEKAQFLLQNCQNGFEKAVSRAINRSLVHSRNQASKLVRQDYTVEAPTVRETFKLKRATKTDLEGAFISKGPTLSANKFKFSPRDDTTGTNRRAVKLTIRKKNSFEVQRGFVYQERIYQRKGKERKPLKVLTGPAVPQMIRSDKVIKELSTQTQEMFEKRLLHEIGVVLQGLDKK